MYGFELTNLLSSANVYYVGTRLGKGHERGLSFDNNVKIFILEAEGASTFLFSALPRTSFSTSAINLSIYSAVAAVSSPAIHA